jgi:uncharacterized metal-binding protein
MPSGKVHDRITLVGAVAAGAAWYFLAPPPKEPASCVALVGMTLFSGLMLSPDLDLHSSVYNRWGPLKFIWLPYQKLIPHRSPLSHSYLLGPLLRVVYFLFTGWLLLRLGTFIAAQFTNNINRGDITKQYTDGLLWLWNYHPIPVQYAAAGLILGTFLHVAADTIVTGVKRRF